MSCGGSGRYRPPSGPMSAAGARSASTGLGLGPFKRGAPPGPFALGQFGTPGTKLTSEERFLMSERARLNRWVLASAQRKGAPDADTPEVVDHKVTRLLKRVPALEPVAPLEVSANRWVPASARRKGAPDADTPEVVDRKVTGLLNGLTMEKFDSISDRIITWANKSENEKDGRTLIQVIRLVFERATDEVQSSEMYARLCRKMMETISPKVQDDEDFERGRVAKAATGDESELYSGEHYAAQKARRQGLGLIKFIGELFKLQMLTERVMHECLKKLLGIRRIPRRKRSRTCRMTELCKSPKVLPHMQLMFQDVIELRDRKWQPRNVVNTPTLAAVHDAAAKEKAAQETQAFQQQFSMSRGGSKRGAEHNAEYVSDSWAVVGAPGASQPRPPRKAGDLSRVGENSKAAPLGSK
ncbi:armadillo-type protein [Pisolithus sp. B1]|nr:armadillo-type protein [Pisolithus sp. B1]